MEKSSGSNTIRWILLIIICILLLILSFGIGYWYGIFNLIKQENQSIDSKYVPTSVITPTSTPTTTITPTISSNKYIGWNSYKNDILGLTMKYPADIKYAEDQSGVQAWEFTKTWGQTDFYSELNNNKYILVYFPFTGTLEDLKKARMDAAVKGHIGEKHPTIPYAFPDTPNTLIKTMLIDGVNAKWYKDGTPNADTSEYKEYEVEFIKGNEGYIFFNGSSQSYDETEMNDIVSSISISK